MEAPAQAVLDEDQQEVIYLVVDENPQGQQVTQIVSDGQLLGQHAQIIMQDGKQAVLITDGNQQQVVLLDDEVSPEHIQTALQHGAIQQNVLQQSISPIVMSQSPAMASTSAINGGQVQYLVTDNGQILTTMNEIAQPTMTIAAQQQQQPPQLIVTQSGLVRVDGSPKGKKDVIASGKSLINQAALQEAASRSPRTRPEDDIIIITESPDPKKLQPAKTPESTNSTLRAFINQAVDKQISEMVEEDRVALEASREQPALQPAIVDIVTEEASVEVQMDSDSRDETDTIGFGDEEKLEVTQGVEPDSTQPSGYDAVNGSTEIEQIVESSMETTEIVPGVVENSLVSVGSDISSLPAFPDQVMQGDEDMATEEDTQLVPQVINVPHETVEIEDTAAIFGENEQVEVESVPISVADVDIETDGIADVAQKETMKQPSTLIIHEPEEKKKSPEALIPTTVITVISPQSTTRRKSQHKQKQNDSESESQPESQSSGSPMKSPPTVGESIASRRERRTSKPTRYYGLDVDYEVFPTDIYRSYKRRESESGEDVGVSRAKNDYKKGLDDNQDSDMQSADDERSVDKKKRGRPKRISGMKSVEKSVEQANVMEEQEEFFDELIIEEEKPKQSRRLHLSTSDTDFISAKGLDESRDSDMHSTGEDKPVEKKTRGRPKKSLMEPDIDFVNVRSIDDSQDSDMHTCSASEDKPVEKKTRGRPRKSLVEPDIEFISAKKLEDSQDSDMHSAGEDKPVEKKTRGRPKKSLMEPEKSNEEPEESTQEVVEEKKDLKLRTEKSFMSTTNISSPKKPLVLPEHDSDEILPADAEKPVRRGRGRPPKRKSITHKNLPVVANSIGSDESMDVEPPMEGSAKNESRKSDWSSPHRKSQVVVEVEVHHVQEDDTTTEVCQDEVKVGEDIKVLEVEDTEIVVESSSMDIDMKESDVEIEEQERVSVNEDSSIDEVSVGKVFEEKRETEDELVDDVSDEAQKLNLAKRRGRPRKSNIQSEVSTTDDDNVEKASKNSSQSDGDSPRRSSRQKETIDYTENSEEEGRDGSKKSNKSIEPVITSAQLEEEINKVYSLQKQVTDLQFVNDSLEIRLAQHSGSPEEIRSLQSRIDKLQMRNNELENKLRNLEKSQKIGINIKGMKFSVKKDVLSPVAPKQSDKMTTVRLHEIELAEQELKIREIMLEKKEMKAKAMDRELDERGSLLTSRESRLDRLERKLKSQGKEMEYKEKQLQRFENDFRNLGGSGSPKKKNRFTGDVDTIVQKRELNQREIEVTEREGAMTAKEMLLAATEKQLMALNTELNEKAEYLKTKEQSQSSEEEESSLTDSNTDSSMTSTSIQVKRSNSHKEKPRGRSPRARDAMRKSASLLTRKPIASRRSSSVSSQEVAVSPKPASRSFTPKGAKLTAASTTPKLEKTASPATTPASTKRKYSKSTSQKSVYVKKLKVTQKTPERKSISPLKKLKVTQKTPERKNISSLRKDKKKTPSAKKDDKMNERENVQKKTPSIKSPIQKGENLAKKISLIKSPIQKGENLAKKIPSIKSPIQKGENFTKKTPPIKSPMQKGEHFTKKTPPIKSPIKKGNNFGKKSPPGSLKSPIKKTEKSTPLKSPMRKSDKKTPSLKSPMKKAEKKTPSLKSPSSTSEKKNLLKSPVYKSRKSEGKSNSPVVTGQKRKRLSEVQSPNPSKSRRK